MKKVKNVKVGDVVRFPSHHYGLHSYDWLYRAGIVEAFGTSKKTGERVAKLRYCSSTAGRYELLPNVERTTWIKCKFLYEFDVEKAQRSYREFRGYEKNGEAVCWNEDTALLVNHRIIEE